MEFLTRDAFVKDAKPGDGVYKYYMPEIKVGDGDSREVSFKISTKAVDRERDVIDPDGWDLKNFKKNPVVLFGHDSGSLPIAKAKRTAAKDGALVSVAEFATAEMNPLAEQVFLMLKNKFLRAASVGFLPSEWNFDEKRAGVNFLKQELLEFSIVPIPANPDALAEAHAAGIDLGPIKNWAAEILDRCYVEDDDMVKENGVWLTRESLDQIKAFAATTKTIIVGATGTDDNDPAVEQAAFQAAIDERMTTMEEKQEELLESFESATDEFASNTATLIKLLSTVKPPTQQPAASVVLNDGEGVGEDKNLLTFHLSDEDVESLKSSVLASMSETVMKHTGQLGH